MRKICLLKFNLIFFFIFLSAGYIRAAEKNKLLLKTGTIITTENLNDFIQKPVNTAEVFNTRFYRIIQFYKTPGDAQKAALAKAGVKLLNYLPENAFFASIAFNIDRTLLKGQGIRSIIAINGEFKLCETLLHPNYPAHALRNGDKQIELIIQYYKDISPAMVLSALSGKNLEVISRNDQARLLNIKIETSEIKQFASLPFVKWMEIIAAPSTPDDTRARGLHRSNALSADYAMGRHYDGTGVNVALGDDGLIGPHIDFTGRLDNTNATGYGPTHGDMTGGILAGSGNLNPIYRGMATGAFVYNYDINPYNHLTDMPVTKTTLDIRIGSTSYSQGTQLGAGCNEYNTSSQTGDQILHQNPELIWVFSAGNNGNGDCYNAGPGWGNITGGYKNGKNVIACANLNYLDILEASSSRGPANDGRIKPDISSNGIDQMSTDENNTYQVGGGTSASCPGIAGITAQLFQAYRELNSGADPEACLLKACMLNTAEDLGNPGPDFEHGWGRVNALRAVKILEESRYMSDTISQGGIDVVTLNVPAGIAKLKVMLYWLDVEGDPVAAKSLVNDLDLTVLDPSSVLLYPYLLDPTPNPVNLNTPASNGVDDLNNVEQVELNAPSNGTYTITVTGTNIPQGPQKYYIVYEIIDNEVTVTYPSGGEAFVPGETETIRWDSFGPNTDFTIEYSTDNGSTWNTIATAVLAAQRYYNWLVPATITGQALVKVSRGSVSGQSTANFSIMDVLLPSQIYITYACVDSMQISWLPLNTATGYEVYNLGLKYMDSIGVTTDTFLVISSNYIPTQEKWFSVSAFGTDNASGRRSIALKKDPGLINCPIDVDANIIAVYPPDGTVLSSCDNNTAKFITIDIKNEGQNVLTNIPVSYSLNNGVPVNEVFPGPLNPGAHVFYNFSATADLSATGTYNLLVYINDTNDQNIYNDTLLSKIETVIGVFSLPWTEDFETFDLCSTASDCEATVCPMKGGFVNEINGTADDIDWRTSEGPTPTFNSGPDIDHNPGTPTGNYLYTEASGGCFFQLAQLVSPCIDLTGSTNPRLNFWYHLFGPTMGELHLDIYNNGAWTNDIINPVVGDQGNVWIKSTVDLTAYAGNIIKLRWRGITGADTQSDMAIDDIGVTEAPQVDAGLNSVTPANGTILSNCDDLTNVSISISIQNDGLTALSAVPVNYQVNSGTVQTEVFAGPLAAGNNTIFTFTATGDFSAVGGYDITAWTAQTGDGNAANDTLHVNIQTVQGLFTLPWFENFETFDLCSTANDCELTICDMKNGFKNEANGVQDDIDWRTNFGDTPSDLTGPSMDHNPETPTGQYLYTEASNGCFFRNAELLSPCIDLAASTNPEFSYWYHMYGDNMGELHTDIYNNGLWLNDVVPPVIGNQGDVWLQQTVNLSAYVGNIVKFRLRGITGNEYLSDMALDDFGVYEQTAVNNNNSAAGKLSVAPNPGNGLFNIHVNKLTDKNLDISVADMQGSLVYNKTYINDATVFNTRLDLSSLAKGVYSLRLISGGKIYQTKLCIL